MHILFFILFPEKFKIVSAKKSDYVGYALFLLVPASSLACILALFICSLQIFKYNLFRLFIAEELGYGFENQPLHLRMIAGLLTFKLFSDILTILVFYGIAGTFYIDLISSWSKFFSKLNHRKHLIQAQKEYTKLQMYNVFTQNAIRFATIFLMGSVFSVSVITNVVIFSMHSRLNSMIYIGILFTGFFVDIGTFALMELACSSNDYSNEFINCFRKSLKQKQYFYKLGTSMQPLRFHVGFFFSLDKNVLLLYWDNLIDWTINCMLV